MSILTTRRLTIVTLAGALATLALTALPRAALAAKAPVKWWRYAKDPRWVQGNVLMVAEPGAVWARASAVDKWQSLFTDIKSLKVLKHTDGYWKLQMETFTFDCGSHPYEVTVVGERRLKVKIDAPGVDAIAYLEVRKGNGAGTTFVTYDLYVDASWPASWFVSEEKLHEKQEAMVVRYLTDLWKAFPQDKS